MGNKHKGETGEALAAAMLVSKGYKIVARNYRARTGEIDIIAANDGYLIFVEVKARFSNDYGLPADAVTLTKRQSINKAAAEYIKRHMLFDAAVRFDVVEVYLDTKHVNHIENAFDSYLRY